MVQPIIIRYFRFGKTTTNASTNEHKFKPIRFKISIDQSERGSWWRNGCTSRNDRSYENGWIWWCMNNSWFFVTCHFRHMSRDESFITWHNESFWLMTHVTKFTILNSFTNSIKDLSSSRVFYLQRFNWLRFEFRLRRPIMINLLEPIRIIRLRRLKFRLDQILWEMTLWRHISVNCVSQMVAANQIRVFQQEPLRKNLGQLSIPDP